MAIPPTVVRSLHRHAMDGSPAVASPEGAHKVESAVPAPATKVPAARRGGRKLRSRAAPRRTAGQRPSEWFFVGGADEIAGRCAVGYRRARESGLAAGPGRRLGCD